MLQACTVSSFASEYNCKTGDLNMFCPSYSVPLIVICREMCEACQYFYRILPLFSLPSLLPFLSTWRTPYQLPDITPMDFVPSVNQMKDSQMIGPHISPDLCVSFMGGKKYLKNTCNEIILEPFCCTSSLTSNINPIFSLQTQISAADLLCSRYSFTNLLQNKCINLIFRFCFQWYNTE